MPIHIRRAFAVVAAVGDNAVHHMSGLHLNGREWTEHATSTHLLVGAVFSFFATTTPCSRVRFTRLPSTAVRKQR